MNQSLFAKIAIWVIIVIFLSVGIALFATTSLFSLVHVVGDAILVMSFASLYLVVSEYRRRLKCEGHILILMGLYLIAPVAELYFLFHEKVLFRSYYQRIEREKTARHQQEMKRLEELTAQLETWGKFFDAVARMAKENPPVGVVIWGEDGREIELEELFKT